MRLTNERLVELVLAARDRVAASWTRGALARRAPNPDAPVGTVATKGSSVGPTNPEAVAWCMVGALRAEAPRGWRGPRIRYVVQEAFNESGFLGVNRFKCDDGPVETPVRIEHFNDRANQDKAIGAFDELAKWLKDSGWEPATDV